MAGSVNKVTLASDRHAAARFFSQVMVGKADSCWEWLGNVNSNGYGHFSFKDRHLLAHRMSFEFFGGEIPDRMVVMHSCDNRLCVNPQHLRVGTQADNLQDAAQKGRMFRPDTRGERNGNTRLTKSDVDEIRQRLSVGLRQKDIAAAFGVHPDTIHNIKHGKTWGHTLCKS